MIQKPWLGLVLLSLLCNSICAQDETGTPKGSYTIPFTLTAYNNISIRAIINGKDTVQLMFHTAASDLTLTTAAVARIGTLLFTAEADSVKSWGGGANTSRLSKNNSLQIGQLQWKHLLLWEDLNSGQFTDGKIGPDLFVNKTIAINFDKSIITISDALPRAAKHYQQLPLVEKNGSLFVQAGCDTGSGILTNQFLLHSGYAGAVLLDDQFVASNALANKLRITGEKNLKDAYGNSIKTKKAILPALLIGNKKLRNVPVGFFEGAVGRQKMSIIGGDMLKRFNIIIDAQRTHIYLQQNKFSSAAYFNA